MATNGTERRRNDSLLPATGRPRRKLQFIGWDVVLAVVTGVMIAVFLGIASVGILGSMLTVVCILAAFGLGQYLLWGRILARAVARQTQRVQAEAQSFEPRPKQPPDEFFLELNEQERMELLQLLERSLPAATIEEGSGDGAAIRRELRDRIRMFGA